MKIRHMMYTKDTTGETSYRLVVVVAEPRENYLCYDVTDFSEEDLNRLEEVLDEAVEYREDALRSFEYVTGKKINKLWRSFKPGGIEWIEAP